MQPRTSLPPAELSVLQALWDVADDQREGLSVREVAETLYGSAEASPYYTAQKLLERLEKKKLVARERSERPHRFAAAVSQQEYANERLRELANSLCDGSMTPLLTGLLNEGRLQPEEVAELRRLLDRLETDRVKRPH
ncbi:MAG: BlaI/MecI/CopY family transcriptional regulator [Planctomycetales bacterium]|nr:BlaI/MecI/CopY family transcriptional regulator [Planctomycetales bacterium]